MDFYFGAMTQSLPHATTNRAGLNPRFQPHPKDGARSSCWWQGGHNVSVIQIRAGGFWWLGYKNRGRADRHRRQHWIRIPAPNNVEEERQHVGNDVCKSEAEAGEVLAAKPITQCKFAFHVELATSCKSWNGMGIEVGWEEITREWN